MNVQLIFTPKICFLFCLAGKTSETNGYLYPLQGQKKKVFISSADKWLGKLGHLGFPKQSG